MDRTLVPAAYDFLLSTVSVRPSGHHYFPTFYLLATSDVNKAISIKAKAEFSHEQDKPPQCNIAF